MSFTPRVPGTGRIVATVDEAIDLAEHLWRNGAWTEFSVNKLIARLNSLLRALDAFNQRPDWPADKRGRFRRRAYIVLNAPRNDPRNLPSPQDHPRTI